ncbi:hypothetical protein BHE74_00034414 [Ensete ventricosum]|nr:hypothetical protein GW17_00012916 [Ensete ventricosum]RWW58688.1 hypothetical protein BHE74_00034414 [Ensete ventricosum]
MGERRACKRCLHGRCPCWRPLALNGDSTCGQPPLPTTLVVVGLPCRGLPAIGNTCRWSGRGRPPLQADNMQVAAPSL